MEDISRELEREIARAKPKPHKTSRRRKVLVVDDFGVMKSGTYLKVLVRFLAVTTLIFGLASAGIYVLYDRLSKENIQIKETLVKLEDRAKRLTDEKEILMARLVMVGEKPVLQAAKASKNLTEATGGEKTERPEVKKAEPEVQSKSSDAAVVPEKKAENGTQMAVDEEPEDRGEEVASEQSREAEAKDDQIDQAESLADGADTDGSDIVRIEKFSLSKIPDREELRVRFNIRNVKKGPGEISGRIFLVLKPAAGNPDNWIVVPKAPIQDGVPSDFKRGQYFSISRFKPVRFTISSPSNYKALTSAAIYIFSDEGQVIYKDVMDISVDEEN